MCTNKSTQGTTLFWQRNEGGKSRIFVERGHRKFDSVPRLSRSSSFLMCSFFYSSFSFAISFFFLRVGAAAAGPPTTLSCGFFCHHRAYNSHFMSPLPLALFFCAVCCGRVRTENTTLRVHKFYDSIFYSLADRPTQCVLRGLFFASRRSRAGVEDNVKLKSTLE